MVSVAAQNGWRAVTVTDDTPFNRATDLLLVPPGARLDQPRFTKRVRSRHNRWLDDHRIGYCGEERCEVLDVTTGEAVQIATPPKVFGSAMSSVTLDGAHVIDVDMDGKVTHHLVTNFDQR
jgi:hypothetical protein